MNWREVLDAHNDTALHVARWEWLAKLLCHRNGWRDYARTGEGCSL